MKRIIVFIIIMAMSLFSFNASADEIEVSKAIDITAGYIVNTVKEPKVGSVGGEWTVLGLARSNQNISFEYFDKYYDNLCKYLTDCDGVMHKVKYTEYSRAIIALTAIKKDPLNVAGYNLLLPLADFKKTVRQGINGPIWALIALNSGNYEIPENKDAEIQATKEMYLEYILSKQTEEGTWSLSGEGTDPDITGMALCALSYYKDSEKVKVAIDKAISKMSEIQNASGGFDAEGIETVESAVQMLVALGELGISYNDPRFVKNGNTILSNILSYLTESGGFCHTKNGKEINLMATEQAFYALISAKRFDENKSSLYDMSDIAKKENMSYNRISDVKLGGFSLKESAVKKLERYINKDMDIIALCKQLCEELQ